MVTKESVEKQLKRINFNYHAWGRTEVNELPNILLPDEEIYEVVNGFYDGGFALLVATNVRLLLVDKKPLNYLTVEDMRFDMINEIDYGHRLLGAKISISAGSKNLSFTSLNQARLRKAINHVQHEMASSKQKQNEHAEDQKAHLEQINQQLQAYLLAQHQHQQELEKRAVQTNTNNAQNELKPSPQLADYLYAQSIKAQYEALSGQKLPETSQAQIDLPPEVQAQMPQPTISPPAAPPAPIPNSPAANSQMTDLYEEGMKEIFGKQAAPPIIPAAPTQAQSDDGGGHKLPHLPNPLEINPLKVAYSRLPMALRNRKFGSPSFHAHSQAGLTPIPPIQQQPAQASAR